MEKLDTLYNDIIRNGIMLFDYDIPNYKAATLHLGMQYGIFADFKRFDTVEEEFDYISHEYGHCMTGTTHTQKAPFDTVARCEHRANCFSIRHFLPPDEIKEAIKKGYTELWQLSEYLELSEPFVKKAVEYYKNQNLLEAV